MSKPIAIIQSTSATLPTAGRKLITGVNVAGILGCILPPEIGANDVIRSRNVKLSYEMAHSAITGQKSPLAFVQGLAFCAVVFSHGNKSLAQLQAGAPTWVQSLLANVTQHFKCGAGTVTRASLETALDAGIKLTLALPAPAKAVKDTSNGKVITSTSTSTVDDPIDLATGRIKVHSLAFGHEYHEDKIRSNDAALIQSMFSQDEERARREAESQKQSEAVNVVRLITELSDQEHAITLIRAMAAHFGFELRKSRKAAQFIIRPIGRILVCVFAESANQNHSLFNNVDVDDAPIQARVVDFFLAQAFMGVPDGVPCVDDRVSLWHMLHGDTMPTP